MSSQKKIIFCLCLTFGIIIQTIPLIRSGLKYSYGIGLWGANGHDAIWHLSLINHIENPFKIYLPIFSGELLQNYHPFFDILINLLSRITHLSSSLWYFQIFPFLSSAILLYLSFILGRQVTHRFSGGIFLMLLNTLSNSFGWFVSLIRFHNFSGETIFWAMQSPSNQINPPFNLSLIFLLILFIVILKNYSLPRLNLKNSLVIIIVLTLLPITKVYAAIVGFSVFGIFSLKSFFANHKFHNLLVLFVSCLFSFLLFHQYNPQPSSLLVFKPFWFINSLIESPDRFYLPFLANMRYSLESSGKIGPRLLFIYFISLIIFLVGNYGWRIFTVFDLRRQLSTFKLSLLLNIIVLTIVPILFIQKGTSWNTIQFLYYALFLANIFLASYFSLIWPKKLGRLLIIVVFASDLLAFFGNASNYLGNPSPAAIPTSEITALDFLSRQPPGIVLTVPYDQYVKTNYSAPIPLYAYETTAYVSAYSHQRTYLEDEMNLSNSGYDFSSRHQLSQNFFLQKNIYQDRGFLVNNQISYIYLTGSQIQTYPLINPNLYIKKIFENDTVVIYQVQR